MSAATSTAPEYLSTAQLAARLGVAVVTLESWRARGRGEGPAFIKIGRRVIYDRSDVERWIDQHRVAG